MTTVKTALLAAVAGLALAASPTLGQPEKKPENPRPVVDMTKKDAKKDAHADGAKGDPAAMMEMWEKANKPGKEHGELAGMMAGEWKTVNTFWMAPGAPPMTSEGTCTNKVIMGGRFIVSESESEMMGKAHKGTGFYGYNNASKQYESMWMDNMSTGIMNTTGTKASDGSFTWVGTYDDPMSGKKKNFRGVSTSQGKDGMTFVMYDTTDAGKEFKSGEIVYTRVGKGGVNEPTKTTDMKTEKKPEKKPG